MTCPSCGDKSLSSPLPPAAVPPACGEPRPAPFPANPLTILNPPEYVMFSKVTIPAALGDETTVPPEVGKYRNVILFYEATETTYIYSSDGIPTRLTSASASSFDALSGRPKYGGTEMTSDTDIPIIDIDGLRTDLEGQISDLDIDLSEDIENNYNELDGRIDVLEASSSTAASDIADLVANKVDKVTGKGLSTNDFTNADKTKLDGIDTFTNQRLGLIQGHEADGYVSATSDGYGRVYGWENVPTVANIPTKTSDLTNDSGFQTQADVLALIGQVTSTQVVASLPATLVDNFLYIVPGSATSGGYTVATGYIQSNGTIYMLGGSDAALEARVAALETASSSQASSLSSLRSTVNTINSNYVKVTLSTTDPGTGATLAARTLYGVYQ